jgi:hypothetical protein
MPAKKTKSQSARLSVVKISFQASLMPASGEKEPSPQH